MSNRDSSTDIYVVDVDDGETRNVTEQPSADGSPTWSPAGDRVAFATNRDTNWESNGHTVQENVAWDVNGDRRVDIIDLIAVARSFGASGDGLQADVTGDGVVDVIDLVLVASRFGEVSVSLAAAPRLPSPLDANMIEEWLAAGREADDGSPTFRRGVEALRRRLASGAPTPTALLRNYPNPSNPETWIPFGLSTRADVKITVYDITGKVVRIIALGSLPARDHTNPSCHGWTAK